MGAKTGGSSIPDKDRQWVYDHGVAHKDSGIKERAVENGYVPDAYEAEDDETLECPSCERMNDPDAKFCDQCGNGDLASTTSYSRDDDEDVQCPECSKYNDSDAEFCDQCGIKLAGRTDVTISGDSEPGVSGLNSKSPTNTPTRNLVRASVKGSAEFRDTSETADDFLGVLFGNFATYNQWYEIASFWEGNFLERCVPGCFADTIVNDRANMRVLYDHGMDPSIGNKPLGPIRTLEERADGCYYEVQMLDTDYNRDQMVPILRGQLMTGEQVGSQLGSSFRFEVLSEAWNYPAAPSLTNPTMLPERSILTARVFEFGPVTFPANPGATAAMRSRSDFFMARLVGDPQSRSKFEDRVGKRVAERVVADVPHDLRASLVTLVRDNEAAARRKALQRQARALVLTAR